MRLIITLILLFLMSSILYAQDVQRIEIKGKIVVTDNDKEGVTIYNTSSNRGTITDSLGRFNIRVKRNDIVEVSALQFQKFTVRIDERVINSKQLTVFLIEEINKLDEVVILPYDLSGVLTTDVESIKTFNLNLDAIYFGVNDVSAYEFGDDYKSGVRNIAMSNGVDNVFGANLLGVVDLLVSSLFPKNKKAKKVIDRRELYPSVYEENNKDLRDFYSPSFISVSFNIPEDEIDAFIGYAESNGLEYSLLNNGRVLEFFEVVRTYSQSFLKETRD